MNSSKVVIRVIENGDPNGYDKFFYVENVNVDINGKLNVGLTGDIWKSMKLNRYYKDVTMNTNINNFIEFVKSSFTPRKKYNIELIEIKLEY